MPALSASESRRRVARLPGWSLRGRAIRRTWVLKGFAAAIRFVNRVAREAERRDHHPDIDVRWNKVTLTLSTHSEGGLTPKDFGAARAFGRLAR